MDATFIYMRASIEYTNETPMRRHFALIALAIVMLNHDLLAQEEETRQLKPFSKIIVSPLIDIVLIKGEEEAVRLIADGVSLEKVNTNNSGKTLKIFLDNARMGTNNEKLIDPEDPSVLIRRSRYYGAKVTAYLTYKSLKRLEMRGDGSLTCEDRLGSEKLKLKLMGDIDATIASIDAKKFVLSSMGENDIYIGGGAANKQVYRLFGANQINTTNVDSGLTRLSIFGESEVKVSSEDALKLKTFGEARIYYLGNPTVTKTLILGDVSIRAI